MITLFSRDLRYSLRERESCLRALGDAASGGVLLATCNRVEVYRGRGEIPREVARHLFRVAAGLESALPGENAIQGQVKAAYEEARAKYRLSPGLHRLFQGALKAGKRVRSETGIARGALSHGTAVLEILRQDAVDVRTAHILIIGVGNLNARLVRYLAEKGSRTVFIANRTYAKAQALAVRYGCAALNFDTFPAKLAEADIVVSATAAPHCVVRREHYAGTKPVVMFDLAVPRDIDPAIGELPHVVLYNVEDIERRIVDNHERRRKALREAEAIIEEEIRQCLH